MINDFHVYLSMVLKGSSLSMVAYCWTETGSVGDQLPNTLRWRMDAVKAVVTSINDIQATQYNDIGKLFLWTLTKLSQKREPSPISTQGHGASLLHSLACSAGLYVYLENISYLCLLFSFSLCFPGEATWSSTDAGERRGIHPSKRPV